MKLLCDAKDLPASECYCLLVALVIGFTLFSSNNCLYYILSLLEYTNFLLYVLKWNRKLSLSYLQHYASGDNSYKDERSRRRNLKKRESDMSYSSFASIHGQSSLSKNDINTIRRSQV